MRQWTTGGQLPHRSFLRRLAGARRSGLVLHRCGMRGENHHHQPVLLAVHGPSFPAAARRVMRVEVTAFGRRRVHRCGESRAIRHAHARRYLHTQPSCQQKPRIASAFLRGPRQRGCTKRRDTCRGPSDSTPQSPRREQPAATSAHRAEHRARRLLQRAAIGGQWFLQRAAIGGQWFLQRAAIGGTGRCSSPVYQDSGRISRLSAPCSITCADQPVMREATKIGVNSGISKPIR